MIYAEIIYTGEETKKGESEFYLKLYYDGKKGYSENEDWIKYLKAQYDSTKGGDFYDIYFTRENPAYLISREFVLNYLASRGFTPTSENFFYKV